MYFGSFQMNDIGFTKVIYDNQLPINNNHAFGCKICSASIILNEKIIFLLASYGIKGIHLGDYLISRLEKSLRSY